MNEKPSIIALADGTTLVPVFFAGRDEHGQVFESVGYGCPFPGLGKASRQLSWTVTPIREGGGWTVTEWSSGARIGTVVEDTPERAYAAAKKVLRRIGERTLLRAIEKTLAAVERLSPEGMEAQRRKWIEYTHKRRAERKAAA